MDEYIINKNTMRPTKIGSRMHKKAIITKLRKDTKNSIVLTNIESVNDSKKIKKSLPKLNDNQFYYYEKTNNNIITKNKSLKVNELLKHITSILPEIIDKIIDNINDDDDREVTKSKMIKIFYDSLF